MRNGWQALLYSITEYEHHWQQLQQAITVEKVEALLASPVAKLYPFYSSENYFWHGNYAYQFRQADDEHEGQTFPPHLIIYWEHPENEGDYVSYTYRLVTNEQGESTVRPIYRESEQQPSLYIGFTEIDKVYKSIWLFRRIEKVVQKQSEELNEYDNAILPADMPEGLAVDERLFGEWFALPLFDLEIADNEAYSIGGGRITYKAAALQSRGAYLEFIRALEVNGSRFHILQKTVNRVRLKMLFDIDNGQFVYTVQDDINDGNSWYPVTEADSPEMQAMAFMFHEAKQAMEQLMQNRG